MMIFKKTGSYFELKKFSRLYKQKVDNKRKTYRANSYSNLINDIKDYYENALNDEDRYYIKKEVKKDIICYQSSINLNDAVSKYVTALIWFVGVLFTVIKLHSEESIILALALMVFIGITVIIFTNLLVSVFLSGQCEKAFFELCLEILEEIEINKQLPKKEKKILEDNTSKTLPKEIMHKELVLENILIPATFETAVTILRKVILVRKKFRNKGR
jgi:hypothetical protein